MNSAGVGASGFMWRRIVLIIVIISQHAYSLTFTLERLQEQCFLQRCTQAQRLSGSFSVEGRTDTGRVDFKIFDSDERMVFDLEEKSDGKISFEAKYDSVFRACLTSRDVHYPMTVSFELEVAGTLTGSDAVRKEHVTLLAAAVRKLEDGLQLIAKEQEYIKIREHAHRDLSESINARVLWWSVAEAVVLLGISAWQILDLRLASKFAAAADLLSP